MTILRALLVIALSTIGLSAWADKVDVKAASVTIVDKSKGSTWNGTVAGSVLNLVEI